MAANYDKLIYEMHAEVCSVFSNPKRLEIINVLRDGEKTVGELAREMRLPKATKGYFPRAGMASASTTAWPTLECSRPTTF